MAEPFRGAVRLAEGAPVTRRRFIQAVSALGGTAAAWSAMSAWGHLAAAQETAPPALEGGGDGTSVIILGAGPAGLVAGYELMNAGYNVRILEASDRVGGHVFTVRKGSHVEEIGKDPQVCDFDEGEWVDLGAWRIPYVHQSVHHYLREFQIPCIHHTDINMNAYAYMQGISGPLNERPMRIREVVTDMTGYTSELLAKALDKDLLDTPLTEEDRDAFIDYLVDAGLLSRDDLSYGPNTARDWKEINGAGDTQAIPTEPLPLEDLLPFAQQSGALTPFNNLLHQPVMMKPAKGMSQMYEEGFLPQVEQHLTFHAEVHEVRQTDEGVEIVYLDKQLGTMSTVSADYCISTIPLPVFLQLPQKDVAQETLEAMRNGPYFPVGKMGMQFKRRFWEEDDWIYGGLTFTNMPEIGTISYPTWDYHSRKGVLQAYYNFGNTALKVSSLSPQDRIELALELGSKIHPQYRDEFETGFSVNWHLQPYALGGWSSWSSTAREEYYPRLLEPDGRIYFSGDFLGYVPGWMEGAIQASWRQINLLHQRVVQGG